MLHLLEATGWELYANAHASHSRRARSERTRWVTSDLTNREEVAVMVADVRPDFVFHLAAQSNVQVAFKDPEATLMTNVIGQLHLLDALRAESPEARIV